MTLPYRSTGDSEVRHRVFTSYYHAEDQMYRDSFEKIFDNLHDVIIASSVQIGEIDSNLATETIRAKIRDEYLRDTSVTVVLVGAHTWQRKHVDWEIGSSIRDTKLNPRSGLLGILLPTYQFPEPGKYESFTIPPRLNHNIKSGFAKIYPWTTNPVSITKWIHDAYQRRKSTNIDDHYPGFKQNLSGAKWHE